MARSAGFGSSAGIGRDNSSGTINGLTTRTMPIAARRDAADFLPLAPSGPPGRVGRTGTQPWAGPLARWRPIRYNRTVLFLTRRFSRTSARRFSFTVAVLVLSLGAASCGRKIGDSCTTSADCDPSGGTRSCDLSQPGGYCVIEGCDARSCPDDSFCVRFYPSGYSSEACAASADCQAGEDCVNGFCVRASLEKRICVQSCGGNGDCRGGYVCAATGVPGGGTVALTLTPGATPKYCRPQTTTP